MQIKAVDDFYALILAIVMIAIESMALIVGAPIMGGFPVFRLEVHEGWITIPLIPFMTAVTAVLFLFVMNLWFAKGFMNTMRAIRYRREFKRSLFEVEENERLENEKG